MRNLRWMLLLVIAAVLAAGPMGCDCGDDDDDDDNDSGLGDDDDSAPVFLASPTDVDEDGEPELVLATFQGIWLTVGDVQIERYDAQTFNYESTSVGYETVGLYRAGLRDYDGDGYAEINVTTYREDPVPTVDLRVLDGPDFYADFNRSFEGNFLNPNVRPDFNADGVGDLVACHFRPGGEGSRYRFFDGTNGYEPLWDSGDDPFHYFTFYGQRRSLNFHTPANFGSAGSGWLVVDRDTSLPDMVYTLTVIDTLGNPIWTQGPLDLGPYGAIEAAIEDFTGDGQDEIALVVQRDDGIDPLSTTYLVVAAPYFTPLVDSGELESMHVQIESHYDANRDGVNDLMMILTDMTDESFSLRFLDGTDSFTPLVSRNFDGDFSWSSPILWGERVDSARFVPADFGLASGVKFLLKIYYDDGTTQQWRLYFLDPETGDMNLIRAFEDMIALLFDIGDYDADDFSELAISTFMLVDDGGGDFHYESRGEILDGPEMDMVHRTTMYRNSYVVPTIRMDIDFDDIPEPGFYTHPQALDGDGFFLVLDGTDGYSQKVLIDKEDGYHVEPLLMLR